MKYKLNLIATILGTVTTLLWLLPPANLLFAGIMAIFTVLNFALFLVNTFIIDKDVEYQKFLSNKKRNER